MGLVGGRVTNAGAKETSASRPLRNGEIPGEPLAVVLPEVVGVVIFVLL